MGLIPRISNYIGDKYLNIKLYFTGLSKDGQAMWGTSVLAIALVFFGLYLQSVYVLNVSTIIVITYLFISWFNHRKAYLKEKSGQNLG